MVTFPFWYDRGKTIAPPAIELDTPAIQKLADKRCVEDTAFMRDNHMKLLASWRDSVVRKDIRVYTAKDGRVFEMGLTGNCLEVSRKQVPFLRSVPRLCRGQADLLELPYQPRGGSVMAPTRREFLIIAGLSAIGAACPPLGRIIAKETPSRGTASPRRTGERPGPEGEALGHGGGREANAAATVQTA